MVLLLLHFMTPHLSKFNLKEHIPARGTSGGTSNSSYEFIRLYCPIFSLYSINSYYYIKIQPKSYRGDRGGRGGRGGGRGRGDFSGRVSYKSLIVTQFYENTPNTIMMNQPRSSKEKIWFLFCNENKKRKRRIQDQKCEQKSKILRRKTVWQKKKITL